MLKAPSPPPRNHPSGPRFDTSPHNPEASSFGPMTIASPIPRARTPRRRRRLFNTPNPRVKTPELCRENLKERRKMAMTKNDKPAATEKGSSKGSSTGTKKESSKGSVPEESGKGSASHEKKLDHEILVPMLRIDEWDLWDFLEKRFGQEGFSLVARSNSPPSIARIIANQAYSYSKEAATLRYRHLSPWIGTSYYGSARFDTFWRCLRDWARAERWRTITKTQHGG
ncbi:hypothetical protein B0H67DRAFT_120558 [Lasiosphaeris hirsuta]|uniref:Uncharacterized protein n=1 Tax=Lasiosphaeris hirsuta TaxID=260670 RepID=A0AA40AZU2_9PEZI|nr:hypothetical protein B0H67DRAFT_120558 [Lasiosphaeris hirsuta]